MASTSGSVYGNNVDGSEGTYLNWQLAGQNVAGNYSVINWQSGWRFSSSSCRGLRLGETYIDGNAVYYNHNGGDGVHSYSSGHNHKPQLEIASGQITVYHNSDGTKNGLMMTVRMTGWNGGPNLLSEANGWFDLPSLARVPDAPSAVELSSITSTSMVAWFYGNGDGGSPIIQWQIGYGTDPGYPQYFVGSNGTSTITGLTPGTTYYFWAQGNNAKGWGPWGPRSSATTLRVPDAPSSVELSEITQTTVKATFYGNGDGGSAILEWQIGYSIDPNTTQAFVSSGGISTITGLKPGTMYYFWARGRNSVGWGPWSIIRGVKTIAGARIKVGNVWKDAIPYMKVNGTWKVARPWSRNAGVWKEST